MLDWGCGFGAMLYLLSNAHFKIFGYELSTNRYNKNTDQWKLLLNEFKLNKYVKYGDNEKIIPYEEKFFDVVVSVGVLEHVVSPRVSLKEIHRILKLNGKLLIYELPNKYSIGEFLRRKMNKRHHKLLYSKYLLKK